ncbi:hypothetical protein GCM10010466_48450 [Planomonospora alba]|uniref:Glycosyltransferase 2-like domain-containing protein n=2 Tax=Planomonospora alba TaxID=161354 RepID=A0ABP6NKX2_9ACTN
MVDTVLGGHIGFEGCPEPPTDLCGRADASWVDLDAVPTDRPLTGTAVRRFLLLARTPADLRRVVPLGALLPEVRGITVVITESPAWRSAPVPALDNGRYWGKLRNLQVCREPDGSWRIEADFAGQVPAGGVLRTLSRGMTGPSRGGPHAPVVSLAGVGSSHWRPGDPNVTPAPVTGPVPCRNNAPGGDLVLRTVTAETPPWQGDGSRLIERPEVSGGTVRPDAAQPGTAGTGVPFSPDVIPPVDEAVVCPIGFVAAADGPVGGFREAHGAYEITREDRAVTRIPLSGALTEMDIIRVRGLPGVAVELDGGWRAPVGVARVVCGLAAAGVPVIARPGPWWSRVLGTELAALLNGFDPEDLADPLLRESFSVRLRRAALRTHGVAGRWRSLAEAGGFRPPDPPTVSVLLCTRRPDMVGFALSQVGRQRGVPVELILALHGLSANRPEVAAAVAAYPGAIEVIEVDPRKVFGDVLNEAARASSGDYLAKMDDDDWYGPDHLSDLMLARRYSNADLVGCAAEFYHLETIDTTVRRRAVTEVYANHVAGSSILVSREAFTGVGGFRPIPRAVDTQLLESVTAAGGRIYRAHGLNYMVRRGSIAGHTWKEPINTFLRSYRQQWRGLYANPLMEMDVPSPARKAAL